jgi:hypothetical protein
MTFRSCKRVVRNVGGIASVTMLIRRRYDQAAGSCLVVQYSDTFTAVRLLTLLSLRIVFKLSIDHTLVSKGRRRAPTDCFIVFYRKPLFFTPHALESPRSRSKIPIENSFFETPLSRPLSSGALVLSIAAMVKRDLQDQS